MDTLGAGDAFIARLLVGIARSEPLQHLVGHATAYATASCASYGAFGHRTPITGQMAEPTGTPSATADWTSDEPCNTHEHLWGGLRGLIAAVGIVAAVRRPARLARRPRRPT